MTLLLDAGAFIAVERRDPRLEAELRVRRIDGDPVLTHGGIIGHVWRSPRQVVLTRFLKAVETIPITASLGRDAGRILASSGTDDVLDAALMALAEDGDEIVTSDPADMARLAVAAGVNVRLLII